MHNKFEDKNVVVGLLVIVVLLLFCGTISIYRETLPVIKISVEDETIRQEDEIPNYKIKVEFDGDKNRILEKNSNYSIQDLLQDLCNGKGLSIDSSVNNEKEGAYTLNINLGETLKENLTYRWGLKIRYELEPGMITVLNKYGDWEDNKFRLLDGTYLVGWKDLGTASYYFDSQGEKVTGTQEIGGVTYYFLEDGRLDMSKNKVDPSKPMVALTFDDGPREDTLRLLKALEKNHARATFFLVGKDVIKYPHVVKKMDEIGCEIGNHTATHVQLTKCTPEQIMSEVDVTSYYIKEITKKDVTLLRPPYGSMNPTVRSIVSMPFVLWSIDTRDWEVKDAEIVKQYVLDTVKDGEIILLHDVHETTVDAAIELIPLLKKKGYQLVTVSEMAKVRGVSLENGLKYYKFPQK